MSTVRGAARRRRQRGLRSWLKHERQSVAMALAECTHHASSARRGPEPGREWSTRSTSAYGHRSPHSRGSGRASRRSPGRWGGQSRTGTWLPRCLSCQHRCWRTLLLRQWTPARLVPPPGPADEEEVVGGGGRKRRRRRRRRRHFRCLRGRAPQLPQGLRGRGRRGGRRKLLVVCGYDAVGKGSALALRCLVLVRCFSRSVPFWSSTGPRCSASWPVCTRRTVTRSSIPAVACARLVLLVFTHRDVLPSVVGRSRCLASLAGMVQKQLISKVVIIPVVAQSLFHMVQAVLRDH